jgi:hypothetical protein
MSRYLPLCNIDLAHSRKMKITGGALETIAMTYNASKMLSLAIFESAKAVRSADGVRLLPNRIQKVPSTLTVTLKWS